LASLFFESLGNSPTRAIFTMGKNIISTLNIIIILIFSTACNSRENNSKIDDEIVLKIGSFEITRYEYEKNKKKETEPNKYGNTKDWIINYINNSYLLADAYAQKYDTISSINKKVYYASITMLGQFKGYLWNKVEEPKLVFPRNEIKQIYKKQNKLFDLEYFLFPDKNSLSTILKSDTCIKSEMDFNKLKDRCFTSSVKIRNMDLLYPFYELEPVKEQIFTLKPGNIISIPFRNGKFLIAHLKSIQEIHQKKFEEEKENIYSNLKHFKEKQLVEDKQYSIFNRANIKINEQVSKKILKKIKNELSKEDSQSLLTDTVLNYFLINQPNTLLVKDFFDYYHNNPFMYVITDEESLNEVLRSIVEEKYLYVESVNLGITNEKKFILDKRDFMNRLILNAYYKNNFFVTKVSDEEMFDYYNANSQSFSQCKTCYVSVFTFKDKNTAYVNLKLIKKIISQNGIKNPSDTSMLGLLSYSQNVIIETNNNKYSTGLVHNILISKMNVPIGPVELNDQIKIFVKTKEVGQQIQPFEFAKETIKKHLIGENMKMSKDNKFKELMSKYTVTINRIQKK
jgi:hypothetical protein